MVRHWMTNLEDVSWLFIIYILLLGCPNRLLGTLTFFTLVSTIRVSIALMVLLMHYEMTWVCELLHTVRIGEESLM